MLSLLNNEPDQRQYHEPEEPYGVDLASAKDKIRHYFGFTLCLRTFSLILYPSAFLPQTEQFL
jgi:hypothetical protein